MNLFPNDSGISTVKWHQDVVVYCPLGKDYCPHTVSLYAENPKFHADYLDIKRYFEQELNGKTYSTESLCDEAFRFCMNVYNPTYIRVSVDYSGYFDVELTKESGLRQFN